LISIAKRSDTPPHLLLIISLVFSDLIIGISDTAIILAHVFVGGWRTALDPVDVCLIHAFLVIAGVYAEVLAAFNKL
jgi:hypothetical protein